MGFKIEVGNTRSLKVSSDNNEYAVKGTGRNTLKAAGRYLNTVFVRALSSLGIDDTWNGDVSVTQLPSFDVSMLKGGTVDVDYNGVMTAIKTVGPGSLGGIPSASSVNGVATFSSLNVNADGDYTIRIYDASGLITTDISFNVFNRNFSITGVDDGTVDVALAPITVTVQKDATSTDTDYVQSITMTKTAGSGNLTGTLAKDAVAGVAVFDDLVIDAEDSYTILVNSAEVDSQEIYVDIASGAATIITENLIQHTSKTDGLDVYQDTDGVNIKDAYFFPDNVGNSKLRTIQPGRVYNFTGLEYINFPTALGSLSFDSLEWFMYVGKTGVRNYLYHNNGEGGRLRAGEIRSNGTIFVYTGASHYSTVTAPVATWFKLKLVANGTDVDIYFDDIFQEKLAVVSSDIFAFVRMFASMTGTLPFNGNISYIEAVDGATVYRWDLEESAGLISYDASGNGNHGTIALGGSAESSFHITDNNKPSVQNALGYNRGVVFDGVKYVDFGDISELELQNIEIETYLIPPVTSLVEWYSTIQTGRNVNDNGIIIGIDGAGKAYLIVRDPFTIVKSSGSLTAGILK